MAYHRGTNGSYGMWADHVGDESYRLSNLDQYFQRTMLKTVTIIHYSFRGRTGQLPSQHGHMLHTEL